MALEELFSEIRRHVSGDQLDREFLYEGGNRAALRQKLFSDADNTPFVAVVIVYVVTAILYGTANANRGKPLERRVGNFHARAKILMERAAVALTDLKKLNLGFVTHNSGFAA